MKPSRLPIERCCGGEPIIAPTDRWWETGVTFNAASIYLERSTSNDPVIRQLLGRESLDDPRLADGVVAIHYRARPEYDPDFLSARSFIGLAVFTPDLELLYRSPEPVLSPDSGAGSFDACGVEDPRITRLGDTFHMVYCGVTDDPLAPYRARLCLATSDDLRHWHKHGPIPGDPDCFNNKDGVLFPEPVDGKYYLLHRPYWHGMPQPDLTVHLAVAESPFGPWQNLGEVMRAFDNPGMKSSWLGAGSVPIPIGDRRYLVIYHTGNYVNSVDREYDLDAAVFDFDHLDQANPISVVVSRLEHFMVPETAAELRSRSQLQVGNVLFACGSYEYQGDIYIVYGGADTYTLAARVPKAPFAYAVERAGLSNPFVTPAQPAEHALQPGAIQPGLRPEWAAVPV